MTKISNITFIILIFSQISFAIEKQDVFKQVEQLKNVRDSELRDSVESVIRMLFAFEEPFAKEVLDHIGEKINGRSIEAELLRLSCYPQFASENKMDYLDKAYQYAIKHNINHYTVSYYLTKSKIFRDEQIYDSSIVFLLKARNLAKKNDPDFFATALHQLGDIYYSVGLYDYSERYYDMVDSVKGSAYGWKNWRESVIRNNRGLIAIERKEYDKALELFNQSYLEISDSANCFADSLRRCYDLRIIAYILYLKGDYQQAREKIIFPLEFASRNKINIHTWPALKTALLISIASNDQISVQDYFQLLQKFYQENHLSMGIESDYTLLCAKATDFLGKNELACSYYKEYIKQNDSLAIQTKTAAVVQLMAENEYNHLEENIVQIKKQRIFMLSTIALLIVFVVIIITRSRKIMKLNKLLSETNRTKDKLFSIISHDLKSPFNSLLGFSELLQEDLENEDLERAKLSGGIISQKSEELYRLITNLLDWSRSHQEGFKLIIEKVEISHCISEAIRLYHDRSTAKNITVGSEFTDEIWVMADRTSLITIFSNLLSNAIKFTPEQGKICFRPVVHPDFLEVKVTDTGVGISPAQIKKLFDISQDTTEGTNHEKGTGLGLLITKEFVEKNGGNISVSSKKNEGSTFMVRLKLAK